MKATITQLMISVKPCIVRTPEVVNVNKQIETDKVLKKRKNLYNILLCIGKQSKGWDLAGLSKAHSSETYTLFNRVCKWSLANSAAIQRNLDVALPKVNCKYNKYKKNQVAKTETPEPKLLIKFHPAKASG